MRHDGSPREMITGFAEVGRHHATYIRGLSEIIAPLKFGDLDFKSQNLLRITKGTLSYIFRGTNRAIKFTDDAAAEQGWSVPDGEPEVRPAKWVGLREGICADCDRKSPKPPEYDTGDFGAFITAFLQELWEGFVVSECYRRHQMGALHDSDFFGGDPAAYSAEAIYQSCGGMIQTGFTCIAIPIEVYYSIWLHKNTDSRKVEMALRRNLRLPLMADMGYDRDWCETCKKQVVEFEADVFGLI